MELLIEEWAGWIPLELDVAVQIRKQNQERLRKIFLNEYLMPNNRGSLGRDAHAGVGISLKWPPKIRWLRIKQALGNNDHKLYNGIYL